MSIFADAIPLICPLSMNVNEVQHFNKQGGVDFLDVFIISVCGELRYCTNFKQTNFGVYMPWRSNNPRAHKLGWITGERARYLRTNSHVMKPISTLFLKD